MLTQPPANPLSAPSADLLDGILNASLNGIIAYESIRDRTGTIVDFRAVAVNPVAQQTLHLPHTKPGWQMLTRFPGTREHGIFDRYVGVVQTGEAVRFEQLYQADGLNGWFDLAVVKLGDGFVITFNDITAQKRASLAVEERTELLKGILNTSLSSIIVYEAIRDEAGQIQDFLLKMANPNAKAEMKHWFGSAAAERTLLTINPDSRRTGQFDRYVGVIETGQPVRQEHFYASFNAWYDTAITKSGDGVAITATNTTRQKNALRQTEQQAELMQNMLNGILLLEPIRNEHHTVTDYLVLTANRAARLLTNTGDRDVVGQTMLALFPGYKQGGFFDLYTDVLKSGQTQKRELSYQDDNLTGWFDVVATRQDDHVVATFTNTTEAHNATQQLERAAANLQAVIDHSQTGIFVFSPVYDDAGQHTDFRFKTINRMVAALVGQTPDVLTGAVASDWFTSYRETGLFDRYKHTLDTGEEQRFEINYAVDGFDVWFDVHSVKFGDEVLVTFTDYTDLKRAQLAQEKQAIETRKTASLLDNVLNSSINGIMAFESIRDDTGTITDFRFLISNDAACRLLGKTEAQLIGQPLLSVFPGNVESGLFAKYVSTTNTGDPTRTEVYYKADGLDFWLDISAQKLGDGFVVTFTDTSVVKRAAQSVEQSAAELQTVIDTAQTGIFLFSPVRSDTGEVIDFRFRVVNRQLSAYVGQQPEVVTGALGSTWFPDYKTNGLFDAYRRTYQTGEQQRFDFHYEGDGIDIWLDIMVTKTGDEVLVTFGDYTPLKKLQQQLEASVIDLQRSNKNLEQFAYVASHDLQEPLRKIRAFGDLLQNQYAPVLGEQGADMVGRMQLAAARMQVLIRDVLAYSRVATKRESVGSVDLNQVINDVLSDLETAIQEKQAVVTKKTLPTVQGDAPQLRQLFQNLIGNALKFSKTGPSAGPPTIRITARQLRGRDGHEVLSGIPISPADADRRFHLIEVADNGIGFEPQQAERIFQVFQRLHSRSEYQGTGIGLAIVQKVVENHQGYIVAEGRPGEGATFRVLLPVGQD